jgi:hypothetical protein
MNFAFDGRADVHLEWEHRTWLGKRRHTDNAYEPDVSTPDGITLASFTGSFTDGMRRFTSMSVGMGLFGILTVCKGARSSRRRIVGWVFNGQSFGRAAARFGDRARSRRMLASSVRVNRPRRWRAASVMSAAP